MSRDIIKQFVRFGIVGAVNTLLSYGIYILFLELGVYYVICNILSFVITVFISFLLNRRFVFGQGQGTWIKELLKVYASYATTSLILSAVLLSLQVECFGIPEEIAPFINLIITIPLNFILNKFWAFRDKK